MNELRVRVVGMGCPRCVRDVTALLRDVPGVAIVTADVPSSVVCLGGTMTADAVLDALAAASYDAALI
jgi:copper chaperone CopZ